MKEGIKKIQNQRNSNLNSFKSSETYITIMPKRQQRGTDKNRRNSDPRVF